MVLVSMRHINLKEVDAKALETEPVEWWTKSNASLAEAAAELRSVLDAEAAKRAEIRKRGRTMEALRCA